MPKNEPTSLATNFIVFLSGVLLSALFSTWLSGLVANQYIFLVVVIVLLALAVIFCLAQTSHRIEQLCNQTISVVDYCNESYLEDEGIEYKGLVFSELTELVKNAGKEMLVLDATRPGEKPYKASLHEERNEISSSYRK
jgi:hypothetical protein